MSEREKPRGKTRRELNWARELEARRELKLAVVRRALEAAGSEGLTAKQVAEAAGVSLRTIKARLDELGIEQVRRGIYVLGPQVRPQVRPQSRPVRPPLLEVAAGLVLDELEAIAREGGCES